MSIFDTRIIDLTVGQAVVLLLLYAVCSVIGAAVLGGLAAIIGRRLK